MSQHPRSDLPIRSFGRVQARALTPRQSAAMATLAPQLAPPNVAFDPRALFPAAAAIGLEIGFGAGEHLIAQAQAAPDWGILGVEPFLNGFARAVVGVEDAGLLGRVRLAQADVRDVSQRLPDACLDRVWILFPDPWPKARHWKRRLIQPAFAAELARLMKPGAELRFATDWRAYAAWTLEVLLREPRFAWMADACADWRAPWPGHVATRYERKRLGDTDPVFLRFRRVAAAASADQ